MPRRIEIELTSQTEGAWTWRAAGAKLPKGTLPAELVPTPATVGDVLRAEVESGMEGLEIVSLEVIGPKDDGRTDNRIEVLGAPRPAPNISVTLAPGARRRHDREEGPGRERPPRRDGARRDGARRDGPGRPEGPRSGPGRRPRPAESGEGRRERTGAPRRSDRGPSEGEGTRRGDEHGRGGDGPPPRRERERRPTVSTAHRNALLATLGPEQLPVAEQLLRGGIPAVRQAIADGQKSGAAGSTNTDRILAIAEELLPAVNLATWKDRATNAQAQGKELRLRELRAVVAASRTVTLDDEGKEVAKALRDALDQRVTALREGWVARVTSAIDGGKVLDALHAGSRPPDTGTRLPADLAVKLAESAGAAMTADLDPAEWMTLLEAVIDCPVRRTVRPAGIPAAPEAREAARHAAGLVPELAKLLGLRIPPPPPRRTAYRLTPAVGGA
jgi:hypothetical protein